MEEQMNDKAEGPEGMPELEPTNQQPEQQEVSEPEPEVLGEPEAMAAEEAPARESRFGRLLRRALRWVTAFVVIFGLGFGATWFARVQPLQQEVDGLNTELKDTRSERDRLQGEVDELEGIREENQALKDELREAQARLDLLSVLIDVTTARLAIAQERPIEAKAALESTGPTLVDLSDKLGPEHDEAVADLQERLRLVLEEVDTDVFAAQRDLEILTNSLVGIERDLFAER